MEQRLQKIMSHSGFASRRKSESLIEAGKVMLNGKVAILGDKADPEKDKIVVNGKEIKTSDNKKVYIALHKPIGYVCTLTPQGENRGIMSLLKIKERVYPVGRLDKMTAGLLILTNDGDFANLVMHPRYKVNKRYHAVLNRPLSPKELDKLKKRIMLEDGPAKVISAKFLDETGVYVEVVLHEGRKHIVRRMFEALGVRIINLTRVAIGDLVLGDMLPGRFRKLSPKEIKSFMKS